MEKKWITYQLLAALTEIHGKMIYHGDIKTENVMVTSWNWVYLADFANFKPVLLPDDNPTKFSIFFDASARRSCYVAPERFQSTGEKLFRDGYGGLTPQMDVFSLGCTIAEMFLEGAPLFTLSQLLQYRKGEYDPTLTLLKIDHVGIRDMITHMIALDPKKRPSSQEILSEYRSKVFPESFYGFLHHFIASISDSGFVSNNPQYHTMMASTNTPLIADADARIDQIFKDFALVTKVCGIEMKQQEQKNTRIFPVTLCIPNFQGSCDDLVFDKEHADLCLLMVSVVCSNIRNCLYPTSKRRAIDMLLVLGLQLDDEYKLDRIVPYLICLLSDSYIPVRISALVALTQLVSSVETLTPSDANIFPEYILPALKSFTTHRDPMVRATYAQCISTIAETAMLFLEMFEVLKDDPQFDMDRDTVFYHVTFDANLRDLHDMIQEDVVVLLTDVHPFVKRALLADMSRLCIFFGKQKANDFLISHIITYLNDPDWSLRAAFCEAIVGIGTFVGQQSLEQFILPMLIMALTDAQEFVSEKVLNSLSSLAELGLIQKAKVKELVTVVAPLLNHPNRWIVCGAVGFIASACKALPLIDVKCVVYPIVRKFLKTDCAVLTETALMENLQSPISREMFEYTIDYAIKEEQRQARLDISDKDQQDLITKLREMGLSSDDKEKLVELKFFISKTAKARQRSQISSLHVPVDYSYVALREQNVIPHTVFLTPPSFETISAREVLYSSRASSPKLTNPSAPSSPRKTDELEEGKKPPVLSNQLLAASRQLSRSSLGGLDPTSEGSRGSPSSLQRISGISAVSTRSRNVSVNDLSSSNVI
jgi:phosphoinositide-3-kinase regulatory subunit 4